MSATTSASRADDSRRDHPELAVEDHPGRGVEHRRLRARLRRVLREVHGVGVCERGHVTTDHWSRLRPDDVVRRERTSPCERCEVGSRHEPAYGGVGVTLQDEGSGSGPRHLPAELCELGERDLRKHRRLSVRRRSPLVQPVLGRLEQLEVPLVCLMRGRSERKEAVVQEHHAKRPVVSLLGPHARHLTPEVEARHDIGNDDDHIAKDVTDDLCAVREVRKRDDHVGMAV